MYADTRRVGSSKKEGTDSKVQWLEFPCEAELKVEAERDTVRFLRRLRYRGRPYESIVMLLSVILHGSRRGEEIGLTGGRILLHVNRVSFMCVSRYVQYKQGWYHPVYTRRRTDSRRLMYKILFFFPFIFLFSSSR